MGDIELVAPVIGIAGWLAGAVVGGFLVWVHAPPIGGELWPYIHVAATIVGAFIAAKVGAVVAALIAFALIAIVAVVVR